MRWFSAMVLLSCSGSEPTKVPGEPVEEPGAPTIVFDRPLPNAATVTVPEGATLEHEDVVLSEGTWVVAGLPAGETTVFGEEEFELDPAPLPGVTVTTSLPGSEVALGFVAVSLLSGGASEVGVFDGDGRWRWWRPPDTTWSTASPRYRDGIMSYALHDRNRVDPDGRVVSVRVDGTEVVELVTPMAHHMFAQPTPDRTYWLGFDFRELEWAPGEFAWVYADTVMSRATDGSDEPTEHFNYFEDYEPFFIPCVHIAQVEERFGYFDLHEWTHSNSLIFDEQGGAYVMSRLMDSLIRFDASTWERSWQIGGVHATKVFDNPDHAFSHGHVSDLRAGSALVFDNGNHRESQVTRVTHLTWDSSDTVETPWVYEEPSGAFVDYLGDARWLPGGNVLIAWSTLNRIDEVTPEGEVVWSASIPGRVVGRIRFLAELEQVSAL